jgi:hypothetical protein
LGRKLEPTQPATGKQFPQFARGTPSGSLPFVGSFFYFFDFWGIGYTEYAIVLAMTSSYVTDLRNVDWELYLLYSEGLVKPDREAHLWAEVDRLEALITLES